MRTRSLSILATTVALAALLGCPLKTPDAASLGAESDSVGGVPNSASHDDAVDATDDVSWASGQMPAGKSALRVLMTDAPVEADSVFVTFCGIFVQTAVGDTGADPGVSGAGGDRGGNGYGGDGSGGYGGSDTGASGAPAERDPGDPGAAGAAEAPDPGGAGGDGAGGAGAAGASAGGASSSDDGAGEKAAAPRDAAAAEAWQPLNQECQTLDLLTLRDGVTEAVGVATLPSGRYGQIRLMLVDASIVVDGEEHPLEVPSGMESGLKIAGGFELSDGDVTTVTLDFDAGASVHYTEGTGYQLQPVIQVIDVLTHASAPGADPRQPAQPGTDSGRDPRDGAGGSAGAGGAGGDGAGGDASGGRGSVPPTDAEPPPEKPLPGDDEPEAEEPPADEVPAKEDPEAP